MYNVLEAQEPSRRLAHGVAAVWIKIVFRRSIASIMPHALDDDVEVREPDGGEVRESAGEAEGPSTSLSQVRE